jgi:hypothetical protein
MSDNTFRGGFDAGLRSCQLQMQETIDRQQQEIERLKDCLQRANADYTALRHQMLDVAMQHQKEVDGERN